MPMYDVGIKSNLNERWVHEIRLELGFVQLYSDDVNVDRIFRLQWTRTFSFGYRLD